MFCEKCGVKHSDDAIFCKNCGARVDGYGIEQQPMAVRPCQPINQLPPLIQPKPTTEPTIKPQTQQQPLAHQPVSVQQPILAQQPPTMQPHPIQPHSMQMQPTPVNQPQTQQYKPIQQNQINENAPNTSALNNNAPNRADGQDSKFAIWEALVGRNVYYYFSAFKKVAKGEGSFNWSAFFFGGILMLYRKMFRNFLKFYALPVLLALCGAFALTLGFSTLESTYLIVAWIALGAFAGCWFIVSYIAGANFDKLYFKKLQKTIKHYKLTGKDPQEYPIISKHGKTSFVFGLMGCIVIAGLLSGAAFAGQYTGTYVLVDSVQKNEPKDEATKKPKKTEAPMQPSEATSESKTQHTASRATPDKA